MQIETGVDIGSEQQKVMTRDGAAEESTTITESTRKIDPGTGVEKTGATRSPRSQMVFDLTTEAGLGWGRRQFRPLEPLFWAIYVYRDLLGLFNSQENKEEIHPYLE
jgi:hypothetical protein